MAERVESGNVWLRPPISWGAIFAGWVFAYAFALLLYLFGAAVGLTSLAAINELSAGVTIGTGIWMVVAWIVATFAGAVLAARMAGSGRKGAGVIHGLMVWALSGLMTLLIGSLQAAAVTQAGVSAVRGIGQMAGQVQPGGAGLPAQIPEEIQSSFANEIQQEIGQALAQVPGAEGLNQQEISQAIQQLDQETVTQVGAALIRGDQQQAQTLLANNTNLSEQQITAVVTGLGQRAQNYANQVRQTAGRAAEQTGDVASATLWVLFLSSLLGLGAGAWGGAVGAAMAAKSQELHTVEIRPYPAPVSEEERRKRAG